MIMDEAVCGFGRTGNFWGHEHVDVYPDLITMAKGLANCFPVMSNPAVLADLVSRADVVIGAVVFHKINFFGAQAPLVVIYRVLAAVFFTIYPGFINVRKLGRAARITRRGSPLSPVRSETSGTVQNRKRPDPNPPRPFQGRGVSPLIVRSCQR